MSFGRARALAIVLMAGVASPARGQSPDIATQRLITGARAGTARYQDVTMAIEDGFKRVGLEFPAMGEHWVSLSRILENRFDATRPAVLTYITVHGKRQLAGVGYTALLGDGERPPLTAAPLADWHEHNGNVIDESLPVHDGASHSAMPPEAAELGATRLAILHVWAWTTNPAGPFVTENWNLPLVRAGIAPRPLSAAAVRAVSLANDSASYYEQTLDTALQLAGADDRAMRAIVGDARGNARLALVRRAAVDELALAASWTGMWSALERAFPGRVAGLRSIRAKL